MIVNRPVECWCIVNLILILGIGILAGAILGATEAISTRSYQRDAYMQSRHIPDWVNLADNAKDTDRTG